MQDGFVTTSDGVRLYVESEGEGPPIVFVAGYTATLATWAFQVDAVVAAGYRAVCVDRRWHGRSERPSHGHRIARHAADMREVIAALGLEPPLMVGGSMGASVCWSCIDLFGPHTLAGIVGVDQTPRMVNTADWPYGFYGLDESNVGTFFAAGVPSTGRGRPFESSAPQIGRLQARVGNEALFHAATPETRPLLEDHSRQDWRDLIATTATPILLLAGHDSQLWPSEHASAATAGNPAARYAIIADAGHATNVEQPATVNAELIRFAHSVFRRTSNAF